jgi:hypothetical protein
VYGRISLDGKSGNAGAGVDAGGLLVAVGLQYRCGGRPYGGSQGVAKGVA